MAEGFFQPLKDGLQFLFEMYISITVFVTMVLGACAEPNASTGQRCSSCGYFLFKAVFSKHVFNIVTILE